MQNQSVTSDIICEQCNVAFARKRELRRHTMTAQAHSKTREHQCKICFSTFGRKDTLKRHENSRKCRKIRQQLQCQQEQQQRQQIMVYPMSECEGGVVTAYIDYVNNTETCMYLKICGVGATWSEASLPSKKDTSTTKFDYGENTQDYMSTQLEDGPGS